MAKQQSSEVKPETQDEAELGQKMAVQGKGGAEQEEMIEVLQKFFPFAHPQFIEICFEQMELHNRKNHDYAAGGSALGNFERVAQIFALYPNLRLSDPEVVLWAYNMKQIDAVLWAMNTGMEAMVESKKPRLMDNGVYSIIAVILDAVAVAQEKGVPVV